MVTVRLHQASSLVYVLSSSRKHFRGGRSDLVGGLFQAAGMGCLFLRGLRLHGMQTTVSLLCRYRYTPSRSSTSSSAGRDARVVGTTRGPVRVSYVPTSEACAKLCRLGTARYPFNRCRHALCAPLTHRTSLARPCRVMRLDVVEKRFLRYHIGSPSPCLCMAEDFRSAHPSWRRPFLLCRGHEIPARGLALRASSPFFCVWI